MTRITQKWLEDALKHVECAEYVKIPRDQFIELVKAARNGMRPVLVHRGEPRPPEAAGPEAKVRHAPPKAL
ncbi:MAG: hypothetical protein K0Q70_1665 [Rhodospirillales bacterium]|nr:hypothetical protein [Rhodospirillales bacterium]